MSKWRDIKTAPRDGTHILIYTTCHGAVEAWFAPGEWTEHHEYGREYNGPVWVCADDAFQIEVEEYGKGPDDLFHGTATHWQPLEAPMTDTLTLISKARKHRMWFPPDINWKQTIGRFCLASAGAAAFVISVICIGIR